MMIAFDTHEAAKTYERAGFTDAQGEALVEMARGTTALPDSRALASKSDMAEPRAEMSSAELQAITMILPGMALIVTLGTTLGKLTH